MKIWAIILYLLSGVLGIILLKIGGSQASLKPSFTLPIIDIKLNWITIIGFLCYAVSFLVFVGIINKSTISIMIPAISGILNILVVLSGIFVFKEQASLYTVLGAFLIISGVFLINLKI